jgi:hypothetical protein
MTHFEGIEGEENFIHGICVIHLTEKYYLEDLELDGKVILKRNLKK